MLYDANEDLTFRIPIATGKIEASGERFTPEVQGEINHEHLHRYFFALQFCPGKDVLDLASGEGYGSALMATVASNVTGVDIATDVVSHARSSYSRANLSFLVAKGEHLPLEDASVDVVVSFETLEHLSDHSSFLREIKRVLRPRGIVVVSSPDREVYSGQQKISNEYHLRELTANEFRQFLSEHFAFCGFFGQASLTGSVLLPLPDSTSRVRTQGFRHVADNIYEAAPGVPSAPYILAVVSDTELPEIFAGSFEDRPFQLSLYEKLQQRHIDVLQKEHELAGLRDHAAKLDAQLAAAQAESEALVLSGIGAQTTLKEFENELTEFDRTLHLSFTSLQRELNAAQAGVKDLEALPGGHDTDRSIEGKLASLGRKLKRLETGLIEHQGLLAGKEEELRETQARLSQASGQIDGLLRVAASARSLETENSDLKIRVDQISQDAASVPVLESKTIELQAELDRLSQAAAKLPILQSEKIDLQAEVQQMSRVARLLPVLESEKVELQAKLDNLSQEIETEKTSSQNWQARLSVVSQELSLHKSALRTISERMSRSDVHLRAIMQSRSWRLSAPLRGVALVGRDFLRSQGSGLGFQRIKTGLNYLKHRKAVRMIVDNGLLDEQFYRQQVPGLQTPCWEHYFSQGWTTGVDPHQLFDTSYYLERNPDVAAAGINPLLHYMTGGFREGRNPHPLFDIPFYLQSNPDVKRDGIDPLSHYLMAGAAEGRNPHPLFSSSFYIEQSGDPGIALSGMPVLVHYLSTWPTTKSSPHPLFNVKYYLAQNPDVAASGREPLQHFLEHGATKHLNPNPLFDTAYYLEGNPDVSKAGLNPLLHFLQTPLSSRRNPHPLFDSYYYSKTIPVADQAAMEPLSHFLTSGLAERQSAHPLFDVSFYVAQVPDLVSKQINPLVHFLEHGFSRRLNPNPLFDSAYYLDSNQEVAASQVNPLVHYVRWGWQQGRSPHPLFNIAYIAEFTPSVLQSGVEPLEYFLEKGAEHPINPHLLFDSTFYLQSNRDVAEAQLNPLVHYLQTGWKEGRLPNPLFDGRFYLTAYPDVAATGMNPLVHFSFQGIEERRAPHPLFDLAFYVRKYPDILAAKAHPLIHYLQCGWREGRDPHPIFSSFYYVSHCPEILKTGQDPVSHYLNSGAKNNLDPHPDFDTSFYVDTYPDVAASGLNPLVHYVFYGKQLGYKTNPYSDAAANAIPDLDLELLPFVNDEKVSSAFVRQPLISVLMPTFNSPTKYLQSAIQSVQNQTYSNWELCICDDGSTSEETLAYLKLATVNDDRIRIEFNPKNGGISKATNQALAMANGEFVSLIDHDDELTTDALAHVVAALNVNPEADVLYSDQDYVNEDGSLFSKFHKPDWSPTLFRGVMYVGHLLTVRRDLAMQVGGCDSTFDFVQDFEFMLRLSEHTSKIAHIPRILYHWRRIEGSVALQGDAKPGIEPLQAAAVNAHFQRVGFPAIAVSNPAHAHRLLIHPAPRYSRPKVTVILHSGKGMEDYSQTIASLLDQTSYSDFDLALFDSEPDRIDKKAWPAPVRLIGSTISSALDKVESEFIIWLKAHVVVTTPAWINQLLLYAECPDIACVAPLILDRHGKVGNAGLIFNSDFTWMPAMAGFAAESDGYAGSLSCAREVSAVTDDCFMIGRRKLIELWGNEYYERPRYGIADLCLRANKAGMRNISNPRAVAQMLKNNEHELGDIFDEALFKNLWKHEAQQRDFYHNPNFQGTNFGQPIAMRDAV